ncbi:MAG: polA [Rickettsiaceae bacterium]|jgi:DNA polymerase-1|nr:polA [Rickettsiaceae bacterium]
MSPNHKNKIALIDGYGFVFRAYHALPPLTRPDGTPVSAVYGFTNMLIKLLANLDVSHIAAVFDSGSKTFRNEIFSDYKANRPPCPEDLKPQFSIIREAAEALNLPILERVGFEADDLIATVAKLASRKDFEVIIVSSDKDLMQLVNENVKMYDALKNKMIGEKEVEEKFFVKPSQVLDVLSLMGDSSDNVPGVRGIGPKTAAELINEYHNLENLLENLGQIKQEKRRQMLMEGVEKAKLSKQLIGLCETVPVSENMEDYQLRNIDARKLISFLEKQGFRALLQKVKKDFNITDEPQKGDLLIVNEEANQKPEEQNSLKEKEEEIGFENIKKTIVSDISQIRNLAKNLKQNDNLIFDFEFENKEPKTIVIGLASGFCLPQEIFYIKTFTKKYNNSGADLFSSKTEENAEQGLKLEDVIAELLPIFLSEEVNKIGYQIKEVLRYLASHDQRFFSSSKISFDDVALMGYVLDSSENKSELDVLVVDNLSDDNLKTDFSDFVSDIREVAKGKQPESFADENKKIQFYSFKNYALWNLHKILGRRIGAEKLENVYYSFERPLIKVLAKIEATGIAVDEIRLKQLSGYFDGEIKNLAKEIYILAGEEFNIGSPKQLVHILFEKLSLKTGKKSSKTGAFSTGSEVLEELDLEGHVIAGKILQWRHFSKLKSTYADALQNAIDPKTKRVHTTLSNTSTTTGRLSSNNPNLQNIPIRSEEGRKIRNAFVASKGCKLVSADYSQIELRVLASIAKIGALKQAFLDDKDIHAITAAQVFDVKESEVDKEMRRKAKAINFGIVYGISAFGLARQLRISRQDAGRYIDSYFATYPGIQKYMNEYKEMARQNGFVETITGRRCFIPNANSKNPTLKGLAERLAINAPIQGSAADIIKKAMIDFDAALTGSNLKSKIVLQVHDELLIEAPENEVEEVSALLKEVMEKAVDLDVLLKVDVEVADLWS